MKKLLSQALVAIGLMCALIPFAIAQGYPNKSIRLIVPFPPGGGNDVIGRIIAQKLTERLGQQVVVDNRAGANGIVGLQALMQAPPDGYTIGVAAAGPMAVNPSLYDKLPYDSLKDFSYVTNMVIFPLILITEKDAVKCQNLTDSRIWVVPLTAKIPDPVIAWICQFLPQ